jgi:hypothetical protein
MALFAVTTIFGGKSDIPDIRTGTNQPILTSLVSSLRIIVFLIAGEKFLSVFGLDVPAYAIAVSFILLFIVQEMTRGIIPLLRVVRIFPKPIIYLFP